MTTSFFSSAAFRSSALATVTAGGPLFFRIHLTMPSLQTGSEDWCDVSWAAGGRRLQWQQVAVAARGESTVCNQQGGRLQARAGAMRIVMYDAGCACEEVLRTYASRPPL